MRLSVTRHWNRLGLAKALVEAAVDDVIDALTKVAA